MADSPYPGGEELFGSFSGPLDLSDGLPLTVAPLENPAIMQVASDMLIVIPEVSPPARELQDYKIVSTGGLVRYMDMLRVDDEEQRPFLEAVRQADRLYESSYPLPPGVLLLHHDEGVWIGRETTTQLDLDKAVSRMHAQVLATDEGLTFRDEGSRNGTMLYLYPEDAGRELPRTPENAIPEDLRNQIYAAFQEVMGTDGSFKHNDGRLIVSAGELGMPGNDKEPAVEIYIRKALDFPDLTPPDGFDYKSMAVHPEDGSIKTMDIPALDTKYAPGVFKAVRQSSLTESEARQLLDMVRVIKGSRQE